MRTASFGVDGIIEERYAQTLRFRAALLKKTPKPWTLQGLLPQICGVSPELLLQLFPELLTDTCSQIPEWDNYDQQSWEPHPLDYDWRFSAETVARLSDIIRIGSSEVTLMGVPSLYDALIRTGSKVRLLDRNPGFDSALTVDFREYDEANCRSFLHTPVDATIVIDSPWYLTDLVAWINFAFNHFTNINVLYFCLWPELLRPCAAQEREYILQALSKSGNVELFSEFLTYDVPLFERQAYLERGINIDFRWRPGDLVVFHPRGFPIMRGTTNSETKLWRRYLIGKRQIAIEDTPDVGVSSLHPLPTVGGWRFDTVSRRDPRRNEIQFWTSRNVVAEAHGNHTFIFALEAFFGHKGRFQILTTLQQRALKIVSEVCDVPLDNQQVFLTWHHRQ